MLFKWLRKILFNEKERDKYLDRLIKEAKIRDAELAVFKEAEVIRLKARLAKI